MSESNDMGGEFSRGYQSRYLYPPVPPSHPVPQGANNQTQAGATPGANPDSASAVPVIPEQNPAQLLMLDDDFDNEAQWTPAFISVQHPPFNEELLLEEDDGRCPCCCGHCSCGWSDVFRHLPAFGYSVQNGFLYIDPHTWFFHAVGLMKESIEFSNPWFYVAIILGAIIFVGNEPAYLKLMEEMLKRKGLDKVVSGETLWAAIKPKKPDSPKTAVQTTIAILTAILKMTGSGISTYRFSTAFSVVLTGGTLIGGIATGGTPIPAYVFVALTTLLNGIAQYSVVSKALGKDEEVPLLEVIVDSQPPLPQGKYSVRFFSNNSQVRQRGVTTEVPSQQDSFGWGDLQDTELQEVIIQSVTTSLLPPTNP